MEHLTRFPRGEGGWGTPTYWLLVFEPRDFEDPDPYIANNFAPVGIVFPVSSIDTVLQLCQLKIQCANGQLKKN